MLPSLDMWMLVSPRLEARYFFLVIRLMIIQCKSMKKKQSIRAEKAVRSGQVKKVFSEDKELFFRSQHSSMINGLQGCYPIYGPVVRILMANNFTFDSSIIKYLPGLNCLQRDFPCNRNAPRWWQMQTSDLSKQKAQARDDIDQEVQRCISQAHSRSLQPQTPKGLEEKELAALAANKDPSFSYTPKPVEPVPVPDEHVVVAGEPSHSDKEPVLPRTSRLDHESDKKSG